MDAGKALQIGIFSSVRAGVESRSETLLCSPLLDRATEGAGCSVEHQIELTAGTLWDEVASRLKEALNEATFGTWFGGAAGVALTDDTFTLGVPNDFTREWIEGHFLGLIRAAVKDATGHERHVRLSVRHDAEQPADQVARRARARAAREPPARPGADEHEVHVRPLRDRLVEPLRPRRRARRRRGARAGVQPALHLRRHRPRQDPPPAGGRPVHRRPRQRADGALRHERDVHERLHQLAPRQADRGVQAALPHLRRPARRRRPVLRGQGADPGGVLPHLQLALRGRPPDRDLVRPAAEGDRDPRGAPALALRVGADHRHPAARPRDADRDPAQEGEDRPDPRPRPRRADLRRRARDDEHPRARGRADARRRVLLAHGPADDGRARRGRAEGRLPAGPGASRSPSAGSRRPSPSASA